MKRSITKDLVEWKKSITRLPLIVRGARQVGKSYTIEEFGYEYFDNIVVINFEFQREFLRCFDIFDPKKIIHSLEVLTRKSIVPGKTLLFLDEIQYCPNAIVALRYFKEMMPELHVISAGSLLEFSLQEEQFSFPVGRVQFMYMRPLSFQEFLLALGFEKIIKDLHQVTLANPLPDVLHEKLSFLVRQYFFTGGMPAAVEVFSRSGSFLDTEKIQNVILDTYRSDFGKYASKTQYKYLQLFYERVPNVVAQRFKYTKISSEVRSRELEVALEQLCWAGLVSKVHATSAAGIPLRFQMKEKKFKVLFLDIGLLQRAQQINTQDLFNDDLIQINRGVLAEQFVGQEFLSYSGYYEDKRIYFWEREARGSSSEVDYVINIQSEIVPIEVKAGSTGRLRSLKKYMEEKKIKIGVRVSQLPLSFEDGILSMPFYLLQELPRLIGGKH